MEKTDRKDWWQIFQNIRHIVMAILFLAMGFLMIFAERFDIEVLLNFDKTFRWLFAAICILYGGFRLFRGVMKT
jgi:hypothetical protein